LCPTDRGPTDGDAPAAAERPRRRADDEISATEPDWSREAPRSWWDPSRKLLRAIRRYQSARARGGPLGAIVSRYWVLSHRFWSVAAQADIPLNCQLGGGLMLPHPNGVVINPTARLGPNCLVFQQVSFAGPVQVGGHVDFGAGAKLLGRIEIGDHAEIGANAVVTKDVPAYAVVAGVPARVLRVKSSDPADGGDS